MKLIIYTLFVALLIGCSPKKDASMDEAPTLKISVYQNGKVVVNGDDISIDELKTELSDLKSKNGVVWYYREAGEEEPPPIATEVISTVIEYQLPVSLSSKPDFSDFVDENGQSKPRK